MRNKMLSMFCIAVLCLVVGCAKEEKSKEYHEFVKKYGNDKRFFCDETTGFLMKEWWFNTNSPHPYLEMVENDIDQPVRCGATDINVVETAQGTYREN